MKKGGFFRNVLDNLRSSQTPSHNSGAGNAAKLADFDGCLKQSNFTVADVVRHGFPESPTALDFDPVQKIVAIGTKTGLLRIFGRPGVDLWAQHKSECAVLHVKFVVNQGALITITADNCVNLWSLRGGDLQLRFSTSSSSSSASSLVHQQAHTSASGNTHSSHSSSSSSTISPTTVNNAAAAASCNSNNNNAANNSDFLLIDDFETALSADSNTSSTSTAATRTAHSNSNNSSNRQLAHYSKAPELLQSSKLMRELITSAHLPLASKWLYLGTERGNVQVLNIETFKLSSYVINWNKAIELSRKTHPGAVVHLSESPQDSNKLLVGFESGCIVLWDLKGKSADARYFHADNLLHLSWHYEGKQFVAAHADGSLVTWNARSNARPINVNCPHAKTSSASAASYQHHQQQQQQQQQTLAASSGGEQQQQQQSSSLSASIARHFHSAELYRPIHKVDWKTTKNNDQFLLFSGGLPLDGIGGSSPTPSMLNATPAASPSPAASPYLSAGTATASPMLTAASPSPVGGNSPSPSLQQQQSLLAANQFSKQLNQSDKCLRSTSLTVINGKSITVLEMDDVIVDFYTICDSSPYENDTCEPQVVIVLLINDFILIDLTSAGYPSYESPYSFATLNESPVTSFYYSADCGSDLIPFLYSTSQNVVSRAPKKGFSDKRWPIDGGEWGQPTQSYPELVITGHLDGTIKFWDMSGVNFDLVSKIKTAKLFEKPNVRHEIFHNKQQTATASNVVFVNDILNPNSSIVSSARNSSNVMLAATTTATAASPSSQHNSKQQQQQRAQSACSVSSEQAQLKLQSATSLPLLAAVDGNEFDDFFDHFSIEKIEFCAQTKQLLVAGACSQVIKFKLCKKDAHTETTTLVVDNHARTFNTTLTSTVATTDDGKLSTTTTTTTTTTAAPMFATVGSSAAAATTAATNNAALNEPPATASKHLILNAKPASQRNSTGFHAELICVSPMLMLAGTSSVADAPTIYCQRPAKVAALSLETKHNILAIAYSNAIVLVDLIQKCLVMNAPLADLYGLTTTSACLPLTTPISAQRELSVSQLHLNELDAQHLQQQQQQQQLQSNAQQQLTSTSIAASNSFRQTNDATPSSKFCRQMSSAALIDSHSGSISGGNTSSNAPKIHNRFFQRQMTAAQLNLPRKLNSADSSNNCEQQQQQQQTKPTATKNKRIISRMLSISTIHSPMLSSNSSSNSGCINDASTHNTQTDNNSCSNIIYDNNNISDDYDAHSKHHRLINTTDSSLASNNNSSNAANKLADKLESSFARSRSSSCSSGDNNNNNSSNANSSLIDSNSLTAVCFVEWPTSNLQTQQLALGDNNGDRLALFVGTSSGVLLLVSLKMPDSIDSRELQLQSVLAECQPSGACKLRAGAIVALGKLTAHRRIVNKQVADGHQQQLQSQQQQQQQSAATSDTLPATSPSSLNATRDDTPSSSNSDDSLSATFFVVTTETCAKVYRLPATVNSTSSSSSTSTSSTSAAQGSSQLDETHHSSSSSSHSHHLYHQTRDESIASMCSFLSNSCVASAPLVAPTSGGSGVCKAALVRMRSPEETCLVACTASGFVQARALPTLRQVLESKQLLAAQRSTRLNANTIALTSNGHLLYASCESELCKSTLSATYASSINEMLGSLYVARELPEMPRTNFFKSLFSSVAAASSITSRDRDDLFADSAATVAAHHHHHLSSRPTSSAAASASSSSANAAANSASGALTTSAISTPATASQALDRMRANASSSAGHEIRMARDGLNERGEKLGELEDQTLALQNQAESYASVSHQLLQKFKDKKWYQF